MWEDRRYTTAYLIYLGIVLSVVGFSLLSPSDPTRATEVLQQAGVNRVRASEEDRFFRCYGFFHSTKFLGFVDVGVGNQIMMRGTVCTGSLVFSPRIILDSVEKQS